MKNKAGIVLIVTVFVTALLSSLGSYLYWQNATHQVEEKTNMIEMMEHIYVELELSDDQIPQFNQITGEFHRKGRKLQQRMDEINLAFYAEIASATSNETTIDSLAHTYGKQYEAAKFLMADYYKNAEEMLNEEQIVKLKNIYTFIIQKE